ncbi:DUF3048 domain-containing protein [Alkalicella caledoniensis]|uniref:DUF3048 domain-containing protein n=1 Tax=Alkalicella caledoniensis TaxID=2731377 RepID=A0A7G9W524_ALKCA|nr:DUF3048 domain-containing protein [Alkalicella caledoniensis]QNO13786.1 DUF3048 domain-containing protein [Alkalicella caledoniensis]
MLKRIFLVSIVLVLLVAGCSKNVDPEPDPVDASPSDQREAFAPNIEHSDLFTITIDNNPGARPQTGLNLAQRIYEVPVEGGITRFIAFYLHEEVDKIGPVRSAREDFLDLILPYDSAFAHCGGAKEAITRIARDINKDLDEINNTPFAFYRDNSRKAPHNLYTSTELLNKAYERRGFTEMTEFRFEQSIKGDFSSENATSFSIPYFRSNSYNYKISYEYSSSLRKYIRYTNDSYHELTDDQSLMANGVIVIKVDFQTLSNGGMDLKTIGENTAYVFYGGNYIETKWRKNSASEHFTFLIDGSFVEINNPGFIFHILPKDRSINID